MRPNANGTIFRSMATSTVELKYADGFKGKADASTAAQYLYENESIAPIAHGRVCPGLRTAQATPSVASHRHAQTVGDRRLEDAHERHLGAAGPPAACGDERFRCADGEMRHRADDERRNDGGHAHGEEKGNDGNEAANRR